MTDLLSPEDTGDVRRVGEGRRDLREFEVTRVLPPRSPLPRPDVTATIYLQTHLPPRAYVVLPDPHTVRPAAPEPVRPDDYVGRHRHPEIGRRLLLALMFVAFLAGALIGTSACGPRLDTGVRVVPAPTSPPPASMPGGAW